ncbi:MAG TPA: CHRD domain-containing protein [Myxococcales bacterium]|jgi:hypothetical protein|nr:CHRD domain-containing protein [Myxococcales bacterium]
MRFAILLAFAAACASSKSNELGPANGPASSTPLGAAAGPASGTGDLASQGSVFRATLSPADEVPPPTLDPRQKPSGSATFTRSGMSLTWKVSVSGLSSAYSAAHVHLGQPGQAGPVLVPLTLTPGAQGEASGEGTIDASAIKPKADGTAMTMADLLSALKSGGAYVNVHTANNPKGEARGQIQ